MDEFEKKLEYQAQRKLSEVDLRDSPQSIFLDGFMAGKKWMAEDILKQYRSMTCKMETRHPIMAQSETFYQCSECGETTWKSVRHCPNCGRKVQKE